MELQSHEGGATDPIVTDPDRYHVIFANDRVRVLEYRDEPGARTRPHRHPDSVMVTLTGFRRRVTADGRAVELELAAGQVRWLGAQEHTGENIGDTPTRTILVELREASPAPGPDAAAPLGPTTG